MPYLPQNAGLLDYAMLPLKALSAPWGSLQTAIAGGEHAAGGRAILGGDTGVCPAYRDGAGGKAGGPMGNMAGPETRLRRGEEY